MPRHEHKYKAVPITGQNMGNGKEAMFGWKVECETCYQQPKEGDLIYKIVKSWWGEIVPETKLLDPPIVVHYNDETKEAKLANTIQV